LNKSLKISQKFKKRIALVLLLNFISYTFLLAFPQKQCDKMCNINKESGHECNMDDMSCCDMMETNSNSKSLSSETEITHNSCNYEYLIKDNYTFIVSTISDFKVELSELSLINFDLGPQILHTFILSQNIISDVSPPIFLINSSFLI
jgi:hypothetical protein